VIAGFDEPCFTRFDRPMKLGDDLDHAVALNTSLGPAAELIRLAADEAEGIQRTLEREIRRVLADFEREDGSVYENASVWVVTATAP